jgi:SHS family lactate transporter-like MFS transporter
MDDKAYPEAGHQEHMPATGETDENMTAGRYIATRFSSLKPPMTQVANPISLLRMLNKQQWLFFTVAFIAWTWDGKAIF